MARVGTRSGGTGRRAPCGRRERRKATTRQDLMAAGRRLFGSRGLYESRIEDLAETAGIAKGTFYQYFSGKEHLILAVVQDALRGLTRSVERRCLGARSLPQVVGRMAAAHISYFAENPDLVRILHQVRGILKYNRLGAVALRREIRAYLAFLDRTLARIPGVALRSGDRLELAAAVFGGVSGALSVRAAVSPGRRLPRRWPRLSRGYAALARSYAARRST
jgi:AcrR family transcriptional regulator